MKQIEFTVVGTPKGQPRPRAFSRFGSARVYDPGTAEGWKSQIAIAAREAGLTKFEGPIQMDVICFFPRPKKHFTKKGLRPDAPTWHTGKPDKDNLEKAVMDALTTLGAWDDDSQVCKGDTEKIYTSGQAGANIRIKELCV